MKGFTLIETIIYVAIIGTVITSFIFFAFSVSDPSQKAYVIQETNSNLRMAREIINQRIRLADSVAFDVSNLDTSPGFLVLRMDDAALDPTLIGLNNETGVIEIREGVSASTTITADEILVTELVFTNNTGSSTRENVGIRLNASYRNSDSKIFQYQNSFSTSISTRQ